MMRLRQMAVLAASLGAVLGGMAASADEQVLVLKAASVCTVAGETFTPGAIVIRNGRIAEVGAAAAIPEGAQVIEHPEGVVTPGLIDACCVLDFELPQVGGASVHGQPEDGLFRRLADTPPDEHSADGHVCSPACSAPPPHAVEQPFASATGVNVTWAEQSSEVTPHRLVAD